METTEINPTWYIAGIGAIGGLMASSFFHGGYPVKLLLKNQHQLATYRQSKLTVFIDNDLLTSQPNAIDIHDIGNQPIHYLLCCVKAFDITKLLMHLKHNLNERSVILLLNNGLGVLDEIKTKLPQLRIISGISTVGAYLEKSFTVRAFLNGKVVFGSSIGQFTANEINSVKTTFEHVNLPHQWVDNIHTIIQEKFALNCSVNILTALFTCKNGELLSHQELLKKLTFEIATVMSAYGMNMNAIELYSKVIHVIQITADNYSSMYTDVNNNRTTEISYLNEHLMTLAEQKKITMPIHDELLRQFYAKFPQQTSFLEEQ